MSSDYDTQLIESVTVRRTRLLSALLYGTNSHHRRWVHTFGLLVLSVAFAAVIAAACVGYSFISSALTEDSPSPGLVPGPGTAPGMQRAGV